MLVRRVVSNRVSCGGDRCIGSGDGGKGSCCRGSGGRGGRGDGDGSSDSPDDVNYFFLTRELKRL